MASRTADIPQHSAASVSADGVSSAKADVGVPSPLPAAHGEVAAIAPDGQGR